MSLKYDRAINFVAPYAYDQLSTCNPDTLNLQRSAGWAGSQHAGGGAVARRAIWGEQQVMINPKPRNLLIITDMARRSTSIGVPFEWFDPGITPIKNAETFSLDPKIYSLNPKILLTKL